MAEINLQFEDTLPLINPPVNPQREAWIDKLTAARVEGYTWEEINTDLKARRDAALAEGYTEAEIDAHLGFSPGEVDKELFELAQGNIDKMTPKDADGKPIKKEVLNPLEGFQTAFRNSNLGLFATGSYDPVADMKMEDQPYFTHIAGMLGHTLGDLPTMMAAGGVTLAASAPTGPAAPVIAMGAAFAAPEFVRQTYIQQLEKGQVKNGQDYAIRFAMSSGAAAKQFAVGAATGAGGAIGGAAARSIGLGVGWQAGGAMAAEIATMAVTARAIEGQLKDVSIQDFTDAALVLGALRGGFAAARGGRRALSRLYAETGIKPWEAVERAKTDETFRQEIMQRVARETSEFARDTSGALFRRKQPAAPVQPAAPTTPKSSWDVVADHMTSPEKPASIAERFEQFKKETYKDVFDDADALKTLRDSVLENKPIPANTDPLMLMRAAKNSDSVVKYVFEEGQVQFQPTTGVFEKAPGRSFDDIVKPFKNEKGSESFWTYVLAKSALTREGQGKETGLDIIPLKDVVTKGEHKYQKAFEELQQWRNEGSFRALRDTGIVSDKSYNQMLADNKDTIVMKRDVVKHTGTGGKEVYSPIKQFKGSEDPIKNIPEMVLKETFARYGIGTRNVATRAAEDLGIDAGVARIRKGHELELREVEVNNLINEFLTDPAFDPSAQTIWRAINGKGGLADSDTVSFKNGKARVVEWEDPAIAEFMRSLDTQQQAAVMKVYNKWAGLVRQGITLVPHFPVQVTLWDVMGRYFWEPKLRNELGGLYEGIVDMVTGNKTKTQDFMLSGGFSNALGGQSRAKYIEYKLRDMMGDTTRAAHVWNSPLNPIKALQWWSHIWSRGSQVGKYAVERRAGEPKLKAGVKADEAVFPRYGSGGKFLRALDQGVFFSRAWALSLEKTFRAQFGIGRTSTGEQYNWKKATTAGFIMITIPAIVNWWVNKDKMWYRAMSEWERDNSYMAHFGPDNARGATATLHALPLVSFFYGAIPVRIMEALYRKDPKALTKGLGESFAYSFVPPGAGLIVTNLAMPIISKMSNYNFGVNSPVVPDWMKEGRLPPQQYTPFASFTARKISEAMWMVPVVKELRMNPNEIDLFINAWASPLSSFAIRWAEQGLKRAGIIDKDLATTPLSSMPGFASWLANYPSASATPINRFFDSMSHFEEIKGSMNDFMKRGDIDGFRKLARDNPTMFMLGAGNMSGLPALAGVSNPNFPLFVKEINDALQRMDTRAGVQIIRTEKVLKATREVARLIEMTETPETRAFIEQNIPSGVPRDQSLTANDKRMLLDRLYIGMMNTAMAGNAAIDSLDKSPPKP